MLRLETERGAMPVYRPILPRDRAVQEVARVKLDPRFGGADLEREAARRIDEARRAHETTSRTVQHPVVIVSFTKAQLLVHLLDARSDGGGRAEIEWRPGDRGDFARRNERAVDRRVCRRVERTDMIEDVPAPIAVQVPIAVL